MTKTIVFDDIDQQHLDKTLNLRLRIMDVIAKKSDSELPTKPSDLLAIAQLAASVDKTVIDRAKIRADNQRDDRNEEANRELMLALMREIHLNKPTTVVEVVDSNAKLPDYTSQSQFNINPGELIRKQDDFDITQEE